MRQVNEAELIWNIRLQLRQARPSVIRDLASRVGDTRRVAEQLLAQHLVRAALARYEVLSDTPLPPGTDLFSAAAYGGPGGSAPAIEESELSEPPR